MNIKIIFLDIKDTPMVYKVDANQKEMLDTARRMGASVKIVAMVPGFVDAVLGWCKQNFLVEIKNGKNPPSQQKLTFMEQQFKDNWKGQYCILKSNDEMIAFLTLERRKYLEKKSL
jgi:hypothetical protein